MGAIPDKTASEWYNYHSIDKDTMYITPAVKNLLIIHLFVYFMQFISNLSGTNVDIFSNFALNYNQTVYELKIWTVLTYMFIHGGFLHILFNMLIFFFVGIEIERAWGSRKFVQFYLTCGLGAGLIIFGWTAFRILVLENPTAGSEFTVGASGAIFALLLAYSLLFAEREITLLLFFILPITMRGKYLVWASLLLTFIMAPFSGSAISHIGHLGGVVSGLLFFAILGRKQPYFYAYNQMLLLFRDIFSIFRREKRLKTINSRENFFNQKPTFKRSENLDETNMSDDEIEEQIDNLLDVISRKGLRGLSTSEKNFLNRVSLLYRHKFPR